MPRRRRKSRALGRNVPMSTRQALTQAELAVERGECSRARELVRDARTAADDVDMRTLKDRFREVSNAASVCKTSLAGTAWKWKRRGKRR